MGGSILAEELLVLAYHPDTGRPRVSSSILPAGLAGALFADLALAERIRLRDERVEVTGTGAPTDPDLAALFGRIAAERRSRTLKWWLQRVQSTRLRTQLLERAVRTGLMRREEDTVVWIFPYRRYFPIDPEARDAAHRRLYDVLTRSLSPDPSSVALLALVGALKLDGALFPAIPRKERRRRIKEIMASDDIGQAVRATVQSIEGAAAAAAGAAAAGGGG